MRCKDHGKRRNGTDREESWENGKTTRQSPAHTEFSENFFPIHPPSGAQRFQSRPSRSPRAARTLSFGAGDEPAPSSRTSARWRRRWDSHFVMDGGRCASHHSQGGPMGSKSPLCLCGRYPSSVGLWSVRVVSPRPLCSSSWGKWGKTGGSLASRIRTCM